MMRQSTVFLTLTVLTVSAIPGLAAVDGNADESTAAEDAIVRAKALLETTLGIPAETIRLAYATAAEWPDSSLGCPEKGMSYLPVVTSGHVVSLEVHNQIDTVHVAGTAAGICDKLGKPRQDPQRARMEHAAKPLDLSLQDLSARLDVQTAEIELVTMRRSSWPDASLGCPRRGEQYAQVVTSGFVIELRHDDEVYTYHTSLDRAVLCGRAAATSEK